MIKDLFPLNTFQQDAVLKRLNDLSQGAQSEEDVVDIIESGEVSNAKPIYCHPINMSVNYADEGSVDISMLIFDNNPNEFTWETFKEWLNNLIANITTARIITTGIITIGATTYPANYLYATAYYKQFIVKPTTQSTQGINLNVSSLWDTAPRYFVDGVNKIN